MDHADNEYTRIYHPKSLYVKIQTCNGCSSCWDGYDVCTDCTDASYAALIDRNGECFPPTYLVDGYIYDSDSNKFLKCYTGCEFCSEVSTSSTDQKCTSCISGYLFSYTHPGNCYLYTDLEITDEKEVDETEGIFLSSSCSKYKISTTGECVNECPLTNPYFYYEYNEESSLYEKRNYNPINFYLIIYVMSNVLKILLQMKIKIVSAINILIQIVMEILSAFLKKIVSRIILI
jgi:hypothetical protein